MSKTTFFSDAFDPSRLIAAERLIKMVHITGSELTATWGLSRNAFWRYLDRIATGGYA